LFGSAVIAAVYAASPLPVLTGAASKAIFRDFKCRFRQ